LAEYHENVEGNFPQYLDDESGIITDGFAERIYFPINEAQVQDVIQESLVHKTPITVSGAGTGIAGGRVPLTGWILATDKMRSISHIDADSWQDPETKQEYHVKLVSINETDAFLTVPISIPLKSIQAYLK
jgi:FAD/FMN-containing dehydrogenase